VEDLDPAIVELHYRNELSKALRVPRDPLLPLPELLARIDESQRKRADAIAALRLLVGLLDLEQTPDDREAIRLGIASAVTNAREVLATDGIDQVPKPTSQTPS
jgi:hypothetical protein